LTDQGHFACFCERAAHRTATRHREERHMKSTVNDAPLRGEAAWRAEKLAIAERKKVACAKASAERGRRDAAIEAERRAAERRDRALTPSQPNR
jgi:hypothetical protein